MQKKYKKILISMFQDANNLLFYKIMKYPVPQDYKYFLTKKTDKTIDKTNKSNFSRKKENKFHNKYKKYIEKYKQLYKSLPFVEEIYLCNSLSFNGLREGSDIDLFIITKSGALRRARFFSVVFFFIRGIIRKRKSKKKFCLSFYITSEAKNLYSISLDKTDIYLAYRITHLYPLYIQQTHTYAQKHINTYKTIHEYNDRVKQILPNTTNKQHINLNIKTQTANTFIKQILELIFGGMFGKSIERTIKSIRSPLVIAKKKMLGEEGKGIIISQNMLKFYNDKRKKIRFLYQLEKKRK